jgi:hypothetical protein
MDLKANHPPTDVINPPPTNSGLRPWLAPMTTYGAYSDNPSSKLFLRKPLDDMWALWDIHLYIRKLHLAKSYLFQHGKPGPLGQVRDIRLCLYIGPGGTGIMEGWNNEFGRIRLIFRIGSLSGIINQETFRF